MILIKVLSTLEVAAAAVDVATEVAAIVEVDVAGAAVAAAVTAAIEVTLEVTAEATAAAIANICNIEFFSHMQTIYISLHPRQCIE